MDANLEQNKQPGEEEEYILLDLDDICGQADIPANAPYILSGLDTLNPMLVIGNHLKLVGEYQETIGTCYLFSERDVETVTMHPETGPSETNLFKEKCIVDSTQAPSRQIQPITGLHRVLKFRLATEDETEAVDGTAAANV